MSYAIFLSVCTTTNLTLGTTLGGGRPTLYNIDIIAFQYPDGNRDAETLMLDPLTKDIIIVSKREEVIHIYNLPFPQNTTAGTILFPDLIHTMDFYPNDDSYNSGGIVAGDISRDGAEILLKSYVHIFHFPRYENQTIAEALTNTMTMVEYMMEPQGEAVGWHPDGVGYFTISEEASNIPCHLYFYPRIVGCMDQNADNYNPYALEDDGSCEYECTLGDVNCDGEINILDIVITVDLILTDNYNEIVDVNEDGELNILDLVNMVNLILYGEPVCDVEDTDGNCYETVQIGDQLWMAENLKVTHYRDGSEIPTGHTDEEWTELETGAYAVYDDDPANPETYGRLYNWYTVDDSRGVCPDGYHVPSDDEYTVLTDFLGGENVAGGKMKEAGLEHWNYYSDEITEEATNESGFTALPAGYRTNYSGGYGNMGNYGCFWSSSEYGSNYAWGRDLSSSSSNVYRNGTSKQDGFSIRCLGD